MTQRVLVVEDRDTLRALLVRTLAGHYDVDEAADGESAIRALEQGRYAVVLSDVRMGAVDGAAVLQAARSRPEPPEVILMTAYSDVPAAVAALKAGAYDYVPKPFEPEEMRRRVDRAAERHRLLSRARELEALVEAGESGLLGVSAPMVEARRLLARVGPMPIPVLLLGESGTGKEVAAQELHRLYGRGPLVPVHCGAIPENLLEAELFGVARGGYTGAARDRPGLVEAAHGGTLFLDEIGELPLPLQVKLNRVLEEGELRRIGETEARHVDVRIVAATHRNLEQMVGAGTFRGDLYFRLKVVQITLPPLSARRADIPLLATRFLHLASVRYGTRARSFTAEALAALEAAPWPGNVRELRHVVERAAVMADGPTVDRASLPDDFPGMNPPPASAPLGGTWRDVMEHAQDVAGRAWLEQLLRKHRGNVTRAAEEAGVERESMHRLLRRFGFDPSRFRAGP